MNNKIKLRTPGYYKNFHCISSECKDNCCVGGWQIPTAILYAGQDTMTSRGTVTTFAQKHHAELTVYEPGEHWFHTPAQLDAMQTWEQAHR